MGLHVTLEVVIDDNRDIEIDMEIIDLKTVNIMIDNKERVDNVINLNEILVINGMIHYDYKEIKVVNKLNVLKILKDHKEETDMKEKVYLIRDNLHFKEKVQKVREVEVFIVKVLYFETKVNIVEIYIIILNLL